MENLKSLLKRESGTRGVARSVHGEVVRFTHRGVADLYRLVVDRPDFTPDATLADNVIGKGAALLAVHGGFAEVYGELMSRPAFATLTAAGISASCGTLVDNIINRAGTDICPIEKLVADVSDPACALTLIHDKLSQMKYPSSIHSEQL